MAKGYWIKRDGSKTPVEINQVRVSARTGNGTPYEAEVVIDDAAGHRQRDVRLTLPFERVITVLPNGTTEPAFRTVSYTVQVAPGFDTRVAFPDDDRVLLITNEYQPPQIREFPAVAAGKGQGAHNPDVNDF